jgi:hypothetical protein
MLHQGVDGALGCCIRRARADNGMPQRALGLMWLRWYRSTLLSRGDDKTTTRIVVVMQRVHQNDLVGYLQEQGGFEVLNLPAIAQRPQTYDLGGGRTYTRQYGELLISRVLDCPQCARRGIPL